MITLELEEVCEDCGQTISDIELVSQRGRCPWCYEVYQLEQRFIRLGQWVLRYPDSEALYRGIALLSGLKAKLESRHLQREDSNELG